MSGLISPSCSFWGQQTPAYQVKHLRKILRALYYKGFFTFPDNRLKYFPPNAQHAIFKVSISVPKKKKRLSSVFSFLQRLTSAYSSNLPHRCLGQMWTVSQNPRQAQYIGGPRRHHFVNSSEASSSSRWALNLVLPNSSFFLLLPRFSFVARIENKERAQGDTALQRLPVSPPAGRSAHHAEFTEHQSPHSALIPADAWLDLETKPGPLGSAWPSARRGQSWHFCLWGQ